ncbi:T9SS type A sorting domain-containing protein [Saccharicrinis sp. FJH62]|uniref:T9SS type A sorting domain-containing protein n=1 Tax=Saccharicrinis sp. FJH62 TaxID=3344657 RepID=UPI0035D4DED7
MKWITILLVFVSQLVYLNAQNFKKVLDADTVSWSYLSDTGCGDCLHTIVEKAYGDTIINDLHYKKLAMEVTEGYSEIVAYLREDTVNGRMYMLAYDYDCTDKPCHENIVYDMTLTIGDTLKYVNSSQILPMIVTNIDTVDHRKVIYFKGSPEEGLKLIEGVGPSREMNYYTFPEGNGFSEILCKHNDDQLLFKSFWGNIYGCSVYLGTNLQSLDKDDLLIGPNPVGLHRNFNMILDVNESVHLKIFNLSGKTLYSAQSKGSFTLNTDAFTKSPGMFIYEVRFTDSTYYQRGILVVK